MTSEKNINFIDSKNGYRLRFTDVKQITETPSDIDLSTVVKSNNGYWARKLGENEELGTQAYYSKDKKNWIKAYRSKRSGHANIVNGKTQVGKLLYRAQANGTTVASIGRNVLTWYTANRISRVNYSKEIDHINGDYTDDRLSNLERVSPSENIKRRNQLALVGA